MSLTFDPKTNSNGHFAYNPGSPSLPARKPIFRSSEQSVSSSSDLGEAFRNLQINDKIVEKAKENIQNHPKQMTFRDKESYVVCRDSSLERFLQSLTFYKERTYQQNSNSNRCKLMEQMTNEERCSFTRKEMENDKRAFEAYYENLIEKTYQKFTPVRIEIENHLSSAEDEYSEIEEKTDRSVNVSSDEESSYDEEMPFITSRIRVDRSGKKGNRRCLVS